MFYLIPVLLSLILMLSLFSSFIVFKIQDINPPTIAEQKPSVEQIQDKFTKIFKNEISSSTDISDVKVLGTASGNIKIAVLSHGKDIKTVKVGDKIGEYEIDDIRKNALLLKRGNERKVLSYIFESTSLKSTKQYEARGYEFSKREIERLTNDPGVLFQEIRLRPVVEEGKTKGFAFDWIKQGSIFEKAGIKQGDILKAINNMEIKSGEDAFRILQALRNEPSLRVTLLRAGQTIDINLRVE